MPFGVTWSKRMNIEGGAADAGAGASRLRAANSSTSLIFSREIELLDDFVDRGAGFEVFEYGGDGHARVAKHPCTAQAAGTLSTADIVTNQVSASW